MQQLKKFCFVGGAGFIVDSFIFFILVNHIDSIITARAIAFWLAASTTWLGNRVYTFNNQAYGSAVKQWSKHMFAAHLSGVINLIVFWIAKELFLIHFAFCLGIMAGLVSNYLLANRFVFTKNSNERKNNFLLNKIRD
ncbi:GtrA family protein [Pseudoalteromonas sp. KJ71-7]|uniref:GtrA family protein n=1 Tax=Pseudoalteromonas sp. KJ71-7 TaxID=3391824 RepID=UPI0039B0AC64|tara:strand:+ start:14337 stop:14750 length:414 start_codon:yes stop_codon:yes gene_type:complete